jgi:hypothetical protein
MVVLFIIGLSVLTSIVGSAMVRMMPLIFMALIAFLVWRIAGGKFEQLTSRPQPKTISNNPMEISTGKSRDGRVKQIKKAIPANEPIRATLITVVEEAVALRGMADRIANYPFVTAGVAQSLHPDELRRKSDDAISVAMDLTGRLQIILENTRGRPRSQRAAAALTAQHVRMEHLRDALIYSRDAIEEMVLTHGEAPGTTDRLARGLRNLTDAIDESYSDPLDTKISALATG